MAESNTELVRRWYAATAYDHDAQRVLDYWCDNAWAEDLDHRAMEGAPDDVGPIRGRDAMRRYLADWYETFEDFGFAAEEVIDAGEGRVVAVVRIKGRARASGAPADLVFAVALVVRDGRIVRGREYATREQALRAAAETTGAAPGSR